MNRPPRRLLRRTASLLAVAVLALPATRALGHMESASAAAAESRAVDRAADRRPAVVHHPRVQVIAHRGFSAIAPENTLPAMVAAAKARADKVEFDVQRTSDGQLIVVHDTTFARTTNVAEVFPGRQNDPVGSFTLADVQRLDAGSWMGSQFAGTRVPTLDELLATMRPTSTNLLLELKNPTLYPGYERQVAAVLSAYGFTQAGRVYVHSFDLSALESFHRSAPSVPLGLITEAPVDVDHVASWVHTVNPDTGALSDAGVDRASAANLQVFAWPLDVAQSSAAQVERMVDDGVSGIITDDPAHVRLLVDRAQGA